MERTITATEANRDFSRIFREVAAGGSYVVTAWGKPLVRIEPANAVIEPQDERVARLHALIDELAALPASAPGRITREDGYA
ncbi:type II toxin-antitoxin system prevent-host-death family antitoxin [Brevundimonas intermedia]|uniref:Type II toxin-antitoxin system prevent-host-death family antitoxin n=1 Tax=Brevundimonas intermedia TaxID=74315 RepID=A0A4Y9RYP7_9CAUL|nr:type II toxin-antitoxin system prevent-host-death family antitoxin [Brevundimonas intermedia]TFW14023.1 type II toxin-antitoxin system prevent-host-death family antitoxin [Brevundimonas intermedia]